MNSQTIDELNIIIRAKVDDAKRQIKSFSSSIDSTMNNLESITEKASKKAQKSIENAVSKSKLSLEQIKKIDLKFDVNKMNLENLETKIHEIIKARDELIAKGNIFDEGSDKEYLNELVDKLLDVQTAYNNLKSKEVKIEEPKTFKIENPNLYGYDTKSWNEIINKTEEVESKVKKTAKEMKKSFQEVPSKIKKVSRELSATSKVSDKVEKDFSKVGNSINKSFKNGMSSLKRFTFALFGLETAMSLVRRAVSSYLSFDQDINDSFTNSYNILGSLFGPMLEKVASLFSRLTNSISYFVKSLTGIDLVAKANEKSLKKQNNALNKTLNLMKEDEITNLPTDSSSGNNIPQIKTEKIDTSWIDKLISKVKNNDFYGLGAEIGKKFNAGVDSINWKQTGSKISTGINNSVQIAKGFLEESDFGNLGEGLATSINTILEETNWSEISETISILLYDLVDFIYEFIENLDEDKIKDAIIDFIKGIDWGKIGLSAVKLLTAGLKINLSPAGLDPFGVRKSLHDFLKDSIDGIEELGFKGFIKQKIIDPFLKEFGNQEDVTKTKMSTIFKNIGVSCINGLISKFNDGINKVNSKFSITIGEKTQKMLSALKINIDTGNYQLFSIPNIPEIPKYANGNVATEPTLGLFAEYPNAKIDPEITSPQSKIEESVYNVMSNLLPMLVNNSQREAAVFYLDGKEFAKAAYDDFEEEENRKNKSMAIKRVA